MSDLTFYDGVIVSFSFLLFIWLPILSLLVAHCWVKIKAMENSTHQIQYVDPLVDLKDDENEFEEFSEDQKTDGLKDIDFKNLV